MKKILVLAAIALMAVSCNKDQKAVNRLDGTWKANKWTVSNDTLSIDLIAFGGITNAEMTFSKCKLKSEEWCDMTTSITFLLSDPQNDNFLYRVSGNGATLETKDDASSITINQTEIVEMTGNTMKTKVTDDNGTIEASWDKQ